MMFSRLRSSALYRIAAFIFITAMIILLLMLASAILIPIAFAAFIAIILSPLCQWLEERGVYRVLAAILCLLVAILFIGGILSFFSLQISSLASNITTFEENLDQMINQGSNYLGQQLSDTEISSLSSFKEALGFLFEDAQGVVGTMLKILVSSFIHILLFLTFIVLFLIYRKEILKFGELLFGENRKSIRKMLLKIERVVRNYLIGIFLVILILAACNSLALWLMDVPNPLFFGVFAAVLNIVPFIGPLVGSLFPALFTLVITQSGSLTLWIIVYFIGIQSLESYLITPNIVGKRVSINPMFTLLAIFVGNLIWGVAGMILFIPLTAALKEIFDEVRGLQPYGQLLGDLDKEAVES